MKRNYLNSCRILLTLLAFILLMGLPIELVQADNEKLNEKPIEIIPPKEPLMLKRNNTANIIIIAKKDVTIEKISISPSHNLKNCLGSNITVIYYENKKIKEKSFKIGDNIPINVSLRKEEKMNLSFYVYPNSTRKEYINISFSFRGIEKTQEEKVEIDTEDPLQIQLNFIHTNGILEGNIACTIDAKLLSKIQENVILLNISVSGADKCNIENKDSCTVNINKFINNTSNIAFIHVNLTKFKSVQIVISWRWATTHKGDYINESIEIAKLFNIYNFNIKEKEGVNRTINIVIKNMQDRTGINGSFRIRFADLPNYFEIKNCFCEPFCGCKPGKEELNITLKKYINTTNSINITVHVEAKLSSERVSKINLTICDLVKNSTKWDGSSIFLLSEEIGKYINVTNPFPYYIEITGKGINISNYDISCDGKNISGKGYILLEEMFWPIGPKNITVNISPKKPEKIGNSFYYLRYLQSMCIPLCGIGTIAIISASAVLSLYALRRRRVRAPPERPSYLEMPEHVDLG